MMAGLDRLTVAVCDRGGIPMLQAARRWTLVAVVVLVAVPLLVGSPAGACFPLITRSDAEAVFKASARGEDLDPDVRVAIRAICGLGLGRTALLRRGLARHHGHLE